MCSEKIRNNTWWVSTLICVLITQFSNEFALYYVIILDSIINFRFKIRYNLLLFNQLFRKFFNFSIYKDF